ncbi:MAG TPA: S1 RNA-binding domain-containing protein [Anaerolineales bacterium]|nr:S1 RNA-binding domain-containing protein [Anaerolineales bacterium]
MTDTQTAAPSRLEDLKPKMALTGTVKKIELFGAFVDVGVGRDGLVHISALKPERVNNVADVVKEGDTVTVWVKKVDAEQGRLDLTMVQPLGVEWGELKRGQRFTGKVVKLEKFGAFVDIGAERPGLVHISEVAAYRVEDIKEALKDNQEVQVQILGVDPRKKQIKLSIKAVELAEMSEAVEEDEAPEANLTAMQLAFRKAQDAARAAARNKGRDRRDRVVQEDLLSRTLANRPK